MTYRVVQIASHISCEGAVFFINHEITEAVIQYYFEFHYPQNYFVIP